MTHLEALVLLAVLLRTAWIVSDIYRDRKNLFL